jgi:hypothetical protein
MTTLTIKEDVNLSVRNFNTYDDLVQFVLNENSSIDFEYLSDEESNFLEGLESYKSFKDIANSV